MTLTRRHAIAALALAGLGGAALFAGTARNPAPGIPFGAALAQSAAEVDTSSVEEMAIGAEDAPVTFIEYASYTCPFCASFHQDSFKQLRADYIDTGAVRFVYREVYFDRPGLWASMVARCGGSERFFGITDMLYAQLDEWLVRDDLNATVDNLRRIGLSAGLTEEALDACLTDAEMAQTLFAWYQQNAEADNITATPSFVIDGELYQNMSYADLTEVLDGKLGG